MTTPYALPISLHSALALALSVACTLGPKDLGEYTESDGATETSPTGATETAASTDPTSEATTDPSTTDPSTTDPATSDPSATSDDSATTDEPTTTDGTGSTITECAIISDLEIVATFDGFCPDDGPIVITDADGWAEFVGSCIFSGEDPAPGLDFETIDVLGVSLTEACPLNAAFLGALTCGDTLEVHTWIYSDLCFCDYSTTTVHVFAVPKGTVAHIVHVEVPEVTCEEVTCECERGEVNACDAQGECITAATPPIDGLPPPWP